MIRRYSDNKIENNTCNYNKVDGIYVGVKNKTTIINNKCRGNEENGILTFGDEIIISGNSCWENNHSGIYIDFCPTNRTIVENNICMYNNINGMNISSVWGANITNNTCIHNRLNGINIDSSILTLYDNNCSENLWNGINMEGGSYHSEKEFVYLIRNTCNHNLRHGIESKRDHNIILSRNTCNGNALSGIKLNGNTCELLNNICYYNFQNGIYFEEGYDNIILKNLCRHNAQNGIYLLNCTNNELIDNDCTYNNYTGIYLETSSNNEVQGNNLTNNILLSITEVKLEDDEYNMISDNYVDKMKESEDSNDNFWSPPLWINIVIGFIILIIIILLSYVFLGRRD